MPAIITNDLKHEIINELKEVINDESIYFCFSNPKDWVNPFSPDSPKDTYNLSNDIFADALYMKKIYPINLVNAIRHHRWLPNQRYQQFDLNRNIQTLITTKYYIPATATATIQNGVVTSINVTNFGAGYSSPPSITITGGGGSGASATAIVANEMIVSIAVVNGGSGYVTPPLVTVSPPTNISNSSFEARPFYVITDELNVYKCLNNNNLALSTVKPIHTTTNEGDNGTTYADGYVWKFMFSVSKLDAERFLTSNWVPVRTLNFDDGSLQWQVQTNGNAVYHGKNPVKELCATNLLLKVRVTGNEGGQIVDTNEYRQISLVKNPIATKSVFAVQSATSNTLILNTSHDLSDNQAKYYPNVGKKIKIISGIGASQVRKITALNPTTREITINEPWSVIPTTTSVYGIVLQSELVNMCYVFYLTTVNNGPFIEDEMVSQTGSGATGIIVKHDTTNNLLYVTSASGAFNSSGQLTSGATTASISNKKDPEAVNFANKYLTDILYIENRKPIARFTDQVEDIKCIIVF